VRVEYSPETKDIAALKRKAEQTLGQTLEVDSEVELVPLGSIGRAIFKAQRIIAA
jgi:phenylacetate-coenzyme A ligase PaaK-like adenylate-forming protein